MKRPGTVWIFTILISLGIIWQVVVAIATLLGETTPLSTGVSSFDKIMPIISIVLLIPYFIFIVLFFRLKKRALIWVYISFGVSIVGLLIAQSWLNLVIVLVVGFVCWDYIRKKQIEGHPLFN